MKQHYKLVICAIIFIISIVILVDKTFTTAPIQISLESGHEVITQDSHYYNIMEVILLIICAFLIGLTTMYIYQNSEKSIRDKFLIARKKEKTLINTFLKGNEKTIYELIRSSNQGILQNALVKKTGLSKVKITRIIRKLELKGLIKKERYGITNKIVAKD